jgi:multiple sugar transport system substrate-binding protein
VSFDSDPIAILDLMGSKDSIAYAPLVYGYSNYSREGFGQHTVRFGDIPSGTGSPEGSMIGGVGLAISSRGAHRELAAAFVEMVASAEYQRGEFFASGGQPGHRTAWTDDAVNAQSAGFFRNTLATLNAGSLRPRFDGYIRFQEEAGRAIRSFIMERRSDTGRFVDELNNDFFAARDKLTAL